MNYDELVKDFVLRTRKNLEFIETSATEPTSNVYEVTQLVNSLLGLIVFPQKTYFDTIPDTKLSELAAAGWPKIKVAEFIKSSPDFVACENLRELMRMLRNAVAHFNIEFLADSEGHIRGLRVWNENTRKKGKPKTWEADLTLDDLRLLTRRFIELMEQEAEKRTNG